MNYEKLYNNILKIIDITNINLMKLSSVNKKDISNLIRIQCKGNNLNIAASYIDAFKQSNIDLFEYYDIKLKDIEIWFVIDNYTMIDIINFSDEYNLHIIRESSTNIIISLNLNETQSKLNSTFISLNI